MPLSNQYRGIQLPLVTDSPALPTPPSHGPIHPEGMIMLGPKIPGTRCPTCALDGKEVWVIPGRCCGYCGTPCDGLESHHH
ncbi:hypothetical protein PT974_09303 [Cladobotryum mycophilum]|uniref:Uncharacterized protein n=1 Tax=Cladobotryum mycophilum TaxID=491253 RepID=A0ABR0SFS7_9HYPO